MRTTTSPPAMGRTRTIAPIEEMGVGDQVAPIEGVGVIAGVGAAVLQKIDLGEKMVLAAVAGAVQKIDRVAVLKNDRLPR